MKICVSVLTKDYASVQSAIVEVGDILDDKTVREIRAICEKVSEYAKDIVEKKKANE